MPFRRAASPVAFESYPSPASDLCFDGLYASDDEMDNASRAAKRRKIEALADSYLQGAPLFILSASLTGPFDNGWVNPWRKDRRRKDTASTRGELRSEIPKTMDSGVQEMGPRKWRRHFRVQDLGKKINSRDSPLVSPIFRPSRNARFSAKRGEANLSVSLRSQRVKVPASTGCCSKRTIIWAMETPLGSAAVERSECSWLKTDNNRIHFRDTDPPTSPTTAASKRQSKTAVRGNPSTGQSTSNPASVPQNQSERQVHQIADSLTERSRKPESGCTDRLSIPKNAHIARKHNVPPAVLSAMSPRPENLESESSLRVISSISQLPKFEYRLLKSPKVHQQIYLESSESPRKSHIQSDNTITAVAEANLYWQSQGAPSEEQANGQRTDGEALADLGSIIIQKQSENTDSTQCGMVTSKSESRTVSLADGETGNEIFPSAQVISENSTLSACLTSLYTTDLPKETCSNDIVPDHQLSTQAALLVAQRFFPEELETVEPEFSISPIVTDDCHGPDHHVRESLPSIKVASCEQIATPDYGLNETYTRSGEMESKHQIMRTQCMVDAAAPFIFSTQRKQTQNPRSKSGTPHADNTRNSESSSSPNKEDKSYSIEGDRIASSMQRRTCQLGGSDEDLQQDSRVFTDQETEMTALPLTSTRETPPTAQNRGDMMRGIDSFHLSEAIVEASNWLKQSFDFMDDLRSCGDKEATSSAEGCRSTLLLGPLT